MNAQERFDTVLYLFREKLNITQKEICAYLQEHGFPKMTEATLSRAKSAVDPEGMKISDGEYGAARLQSWLEVLENWLENFDFILSNDHTYYEHQSTGRKYSHIFQGKQKIRTRDGIVESYRSIPRELLREKIQQGQEIRLLQTFMSTAETYAESFEGCLRRGGHIKLLLMNPRGMAAKLRSRSFPDPSVDVESMIMQNLRILQQIPEGMGKLEIRFYDEFPGIEMFGFEDRIFYGLYLHKKFAKDGCFFELINQSNFQLTRDLNKNWDEIWQEAVPVGALTGNWEGPHINRFLCHYVRDGHYRTFDMSVNQLTLDVLIHNTPSSEKFKGHLDLGNDRVISIQASTSNEMENGRLIPVKKRTASFLIYNSAQGFWQQHLSSGVFINRTPDGTLQANLILIENLKLSAGKSHDFTKEEYLMLIQLYLGNQELKADDIPSCTLPGLKKLLRQKDQRQMNQKRRLPLLAGKFQLFYTGLDENRQPVICRRPLIISKEKNRAKREIWNENRSKGFSIFMPDTRKILLQHLNPEIIDSELITLRRTGTSWNYFEGQLTKFSEKMEINTIDCYLIRAESLPDTLPYHIPVGSKIHEALTKIGQFSQIFPMEESHSIALPENG